MHSFRSLLCLLGCISGKHAPLLFTPSLSSEFFSAFITSSFTAHVLIMMAGISLDIVAHEEKVMENY